uniref:NUDE domain-containing protein n=2 Tax=Plectus sambesii TaxID=2011161 RepID=A0A914XNT0_9BILA
MAEDTVEYWRAQAEKYKKNYEAAQEELDEFQVQSRELEKELETQLSQLEKKNKDASIANELITRERDSLRDRLESSQSDSVKQTTRLEEQLTRVTQHRDELQRYIRELEQTNDDLERAKRNVSAMVEDFEKRMNETLERNALLESELDEKETLQECIQRLKEETRDLRQEITVREIKEKDKPLVPSDHPMEVDPKERHERTSTDKDARPTTKVSAVPRSQTVDNSIATPSRLPLATHSATPVTPSARISALNIVGDLLRKVGALETKLASCRKYAAQDPGGGPEPKQPHLSSVQVTNGARPWQHS